MENNNPNNNIKWVGVAILAVVVVIAVMLLLPKSSASKYKNLDVFAQCLTEKGAVMYGAYWCSHCKAQKQAFGTAFKSIKYIECTEDPKSCEIAGIQGYPTGKVGDEVLIGEQPLEFLAEKPQCLLEKVI